MEIKRVFDLLDNYVEKYPNQQVALAGKKNGQWVNYSATSYKEHADTLSYALIELGIEKGDKVAMILTNRPEWNMLDMAISQIGAITVRCILPSAKRITVTSLLTAMPRWSSSMALV